MFEDIASDTTSGASKLTRQAALKLADLSDVLKDEDPGTLWNKLVDACSDLVRAQREMAPILNLAGAVLAAAERVVLSGRSPEAAAQAVRLECDRIAEFGEEHLAELGARGADLVEDGAIVATLSDGESVRAVLEAAAAADRSFGVIVSESRPGLEGVTLARRLSGLGIHTTLVTDAALPGLVRGASLALVGADSISEESLVNKIGSYGLALAAHTSGVPVIAAALKDKLIPAALRGDPARPRDPAEVLADPPESVVVANRYFEVVPLALLSAIVTEDGTVSPERVPELLRERPVPPALLQLLFAPPRAAREGA